MPRRIACAAAAILLWMQPAVAQDVTFTPPTVQAIPAYPDLDLAVPTKFLWLHKADPVTIQQKIAAGHRLTRISKVSSSPPLFTAVFVKNAGAFAGSTSLRTNVSLSQLLALNTPTTRVADIAVYQASDKTTRYAAVVVENGPKKTSLLVVASPSIADLQAKVAASEGRIVDLELQVKMTPVIGAPPVFTHQFSAVVIESRSDFRKQCIVQGKVLDIDRAIFSADPCASAAGGQRYPKWRMITAVAEDATFLKSKAVHATPADEFYAVLEELKPEEYAWWNANLDHNPPKQPMRDLGRAAWYLDGRYADLKPYVSTGGVLKYLGMLIDNAAAPLPMTGAQTATDVFFKPFTDKFVRNMRHFGETGGTVAVRKDGRLIYAKAFGYSSLGASEAARCYGNGAGECAGVAPPVRVPATETMQFRVASVSKTVAGIAITKLIDEGMTLSNGKKLSYSTRPFGEIFAESRASPKLNQIQLRHLLAHTVGLKDGIDDQHGRINESTLGGKLYDENDWLRLLDQDLPNAPGAVAKYNNAHYMLLGRIVQKLTGDDPSHGYFNYIKTKLMAPVKATRIAPTTATPSSGPVFPEPSFYGPPGDDSRHAWGRAGTWIVADALDLRLARGNLTVAPLDLLRLYGGADGSLKGFARTISLQRWLELLHTVPNDDPKTYAGDHILGFRNKRPAPSCTSTDLTQDLTQCAANVTLSHGGWHPKSAGALVKLWPDGLGVVAAFNTDYLWSVGNAGNNVQDELEAFAKLQSSWPANDFFPAYVNP